MARPREFDEGRAVDAAMRAFWANGYEATSTEELCEATGLGRSSIYNAFTSKHALFRTTLTRYMAEKNAIYDDLRDGEGPVRDRVRRLFRWTMERGDGNPAGCLVVNSMVEMSPRDPEIAELLRRDYESRREALRVAFETGQRSGEIDPAKDPGVLADFIIATISGIRVADRSGADPAMLAAVAETALAAI
jgi:TetR/AcrR family transcriptional regulator, transcriptional repressor for nem operon